MPTWSVTQSCAAVDRAIEELSRFVTTHPEGQVVVELLDKQAAATAPALLGEAAGVLADHEHALGRWRRKQASKRTKPKSSWRYFLERYRSLTWLVHRELEVPTFLPGNVSGSGQALLQLGDTWDAGEILGPLLEDDALEGHGLDQALVFHGGWGQEGWAFDTRITSPTGEHPICRFSMDEPLPGFPHARNLGRVRRENIVPFGVWLEREVKRLIKRLRPVLRALALAQQERVARPAAVSAAAPATPLPPTAILAAAAKLGPSPTEWLRDEASSEVWLSENSWATNQQRVVHDGSALVQSRRAGDHGNGVALLAADRKLMGRRAELRVLLAREVPTRRAFVSIEALGRLLRVVRVVPNGWVHEVAEVLKTPAEAQARARALQAKLSPSWKPVMASKRTFVSFPEKRSLHGPWVRVRGQTVEVGGFGANARKHTARGAAALAGLLDEVLDGLAGQALLTNVDWT